MKVCCLAAVLALAMQANPSFSNTPCRSELHWCHDMYTWSSPGVWAGWEKGCRHLRHKSLLPEMPHLKILLSTLESQPTSIRFLLLTLSPSKIAQQLSDGKHTCLSPAMAALQGLQCGTASA